MQVRCNASPMHYVPVDLSLAYLLPSPMHYVPVDLSLAYLLLIMFLVVVPSIYNIGTGCLGHRHSLLCTRNTYVFLYLSAHAWNLEHKTPSKTQKICSSRTQQQHVTVSDSPNYTHDKVQKKLIEKLKNNNKATTVID